MLETSQEIAASIGARVRVRRLAMNLSQVHAAERAGVAYRTWRRLEAEGRASIDDLIRAAIALRCEQGLAGLFPEPAANSMEALLRQQRTAHPKRRQRAPSSKTPA